MWHPTLLLLACYASASPPWSTAQEQKQQQEHTASPCLIIPHCALQEDLLTPSASCPTQHHTTAWGESGTSTQPGHSGTFWTHCTWGHRWQAAGRPSVHSKPPPRWLKLPHLQYFRQSTISKEPPRSTQTCYPLSFATADWDIKLFCDFFRMKAHRLTFQDWFHCA